MADRWTREQGEAIAEPRHLLLAANAGTGKTSTVVGKILWRLGHSIPDAIDGPVPGCPDPCDLDAVAAITFTEKAAQDLRRKLQEALAERGSAPGDLDRAYVGTIHGFCAEILRQHALRLDIDPSFRVMDARETSLHLSELLRDTVLDALERGEPDAVELLKDAPLDRNGPYGTSVTDLVRSAMRDLRWHRDRLADWLAPDTDGTGPGGVLDLDRIRRLGWGGRGSRPEEETGEERYLGHSAAVFRLAYRALGGWLTLLENENRRDFDSLVLDVRRLLTHERHSPALDALRARFRLLVVDEFQDTDTAQRDIVFAIGGIGDAGAVHGIPSASQLFLVGDPKQSIYGFRGADVRVWNEVEATFREIGSVRRLGSNFRSDPSLVELANRACDPAFQEAGEALHAVDPFAVVRYDPLDPAVGARPGAGIEWLAVDAEGSADDRLRSGASLIAGRIEALLGPDGRNGIRDGADRGHPVVPADIAVLALTRRTLGAVEEALRQRGIPCWNAASSGLAERQEVLDAITALRLADNPHDDLRAFAYLRSPFVGLRDEAIARIGLDRSLPRGGLLRRAEAWLDALEEGTVAAWPSADSPMVEPTERDALRRGLAAIREAGSLVGRAEPEEILEGLLSRTAYRLHLRLREGGDEARANLERLKTVLGQYRSLSLADFLISWDRATGDRDADLAAAILPAAGEGAVLLTTIHSAKGLEWPIVVFARADDGGSGRRPGRFTGWTDRELGPVLLPPADDRGERSRQAERKRMLEERAETARLLYVALTRARERLIVAAPLEEPAGQASWIAAALPGEAGGDPQNARSAAASAGDARVGGERHAAAEDPGTGTGRQLDAFGLHDPEQDERGQLNLLSVGNVGPGAGQRPDGRDTAARIPFTVVRSVDPIQTELNPPPVSLRWLEGVESMPAPTSTRGLPPPTAARLRSATEMALERNDPEGWELRFVHGVVPAERFAAERESAPDGDRSGGGAGARDMPGRVRGTIVHGILERAELDPSGEELDRLLDEAIHDLAEDEAFLAAVRPGSVARDRLRQEIAEILSGDDWRELVSADHHREMPFVHFAGPADWRQGRIDLYVPPGAFAGPDGANARVIDFKTDRVQGDLSRAAERYDIQAAVYRDAVRAILGERIGTVAGGGVRVVLHFTERNRGVEV